MNNKLKVFKESFIQAMMEDYEILTELKKKELQKRSGVFTLFSLYQQLIKKLNNNSITVDEQKTLDYLIDKYGTALSKFDVNDFNGFIETRIRPVLNEFLHNENKQCDKINGKVTPFLLTTTNNEYTEENDPVYVFCGRQHSTQNIQTDFDDQEDKNFGVLHAWFEHYKKEYGDKSVDECLNILKLLPEALEKGIKYYPLWKHNNSIVYVYGENVFVISIHTRDSISRQNNIPHNDFRFLRTFYKLDIAKNRKYWAHIVVEDLARKDDYFNDKKKINRILLSNYIDKLFNDNENYASNITELSGFNFIYNNFKQACCLCKYIGNSIGDFLNENNITGTKQLPYKNAVDTCKQIFANYDDVQIDFSTFKPGKILSTLSLLTLS